MKPKRYLASSKTSNAIDVKNFARAESSTNALTPFSRIDFATVLSWSLRNNAVYHERGWKQI